ncbi:uncharacterized protein HD556DRAFT_1525403 [Suillus plorans]|uniref:C2H2-type domain-containing protein n=1 Tax=Suillus plorans TaxID=116603 RepID=A0A9P7J0P1_9AGAM|nr:uncharacterized protein HD556DRAFT_1525403 [Suillus plorans]KAG1798905.1 hypothetical protein HD556DRAFT_1525403 [Suillus plorans]
MPKTCACPICNQNFPGFDDCKVYEAMHSPKNVYFCPWEGCIFATPHEASFHYHVDRYMGERSFICPREFCNYRTHTSSNLTQHRKKKHGYVPRPCNRCGPSATNSSGAQASSQPPPPAEPLPLGAFHQYQLQPIQPQAMQSYLTQYQPQSTQYQAPLHQSLEVFHGPAGTADYYTTYTRVARAPDRWTEVCICPGVLESSLKKPRDQCRRY